MDSEPVVMLGQLYSSHALTAVFLDCHELQSYLARLPWITYRSNFRPFYNVDTASCTLTEITSDVRWGWTVRVGQMMVLSAIQRALGAPRWPSFNLKSIGLKLHISCIKSPKWPIGWTGSLETGTLLQASALHWKLGCRRCS
jgi:hypothetical protein